MAIYRTISMGFWTDTKIVDEFTPEDKYFMLYCLTNPYTNLCGCYEISIKQITRDTGYNEETIQKLLERFDNKYNIIKYSNSNKELYIRNWYKYNWTKSDKLDKPLLNEIKKIKTISFKQELCELYNKRDTVSIPYGYPMDTSVSVSVNNNINNINNNNNININNNIPYKEIIDYLNEKANTRYRSTSDNTKKHIKARFNDGYTLDDFKKVIDIKTKEWLKSDMEKYLRPETLFGSKFENYVNQKEKKSMKQLLDEL